MRRCVVWYDCVKAQLLGCVGPLRVGAGWAVVGSACGTKSANTEDIAPTGSAYFPHVAVVTLIGSAEHADTSRALRVHPRSR